MIDTSDIDNIPKIEATYHPIGFVTTLRLGGPRVTFTTTSLFEQEYLGL